MPIQWDFTCRESTPAASSSTASSLPSSIVKPSGPAPISMAFMRTCTGKSGPTRCLMPWTISTTTLALFSMLCGPYRSSRLFQKRERKVGSRWSSAALISMPSTPPRAARTAPLTNVSTTSSTSAVVSACGGSGSWTSNGEATVTADAAIRRLPTA